MLAVPSSKTQRLNLRIAEDDRALFDRAASAQHESLSQFLVESGRERAERLLADRAAFRISPENWDVLVAAMDRPAQVRPELARLFARARPE
jgi:uncharacterized protein (DUF1778 family)